MAAKQILTVAEMAAADRAAVAAGTPALELMSRAGAAVVGAVVCRHAPCDTLVLCGPGDNGGDGYVIARLLAEQGWPVRVAAAASPRSESAKAMAAQWRGETVDLEGELEAELYIDAIFGAGLSGPLTGDVARVIQQINSAPERVVAVDVPTGLPGDTGQPLGVCGRAALTVTFHARKPAHVLEPGRGRCGEVIVADIGLGDITSLLAENGPDLWGARFPWPTAASHKHARGRLVVVSGPAWNTGAARLAARAGLRIGAGVVSILSPPDALAANAAHLEAIMLRPFETEAELEGLATEVDAAVIGPAAGVNETTLMNVLALARTGAALILDADAITVFQQDPEELFSVLDRDDVLTPHPGEFDRLFPGVLENGPDRISAARKAAELADAVVLLKGADTVVAAPDGRAAVALNGSPWLATAGTGDVLAGYIGGLIAQGMDSFEAACAAAWIHAEAAHAHGPGLIAEDLPGLTPAVLRGLYGAG